MTKVENKASSLKSGGIVAGGLFLLTLLVFRAVLWPGQALFTTDDSLGSLIMRKHLLPSAWWGGWSDAELLGIASPMFLNPTNFLLLIFPATFFNNWINAFDLFVGSFFLVLFLRGRGLAWSAATIGALTAYWVGSNLTLVYAGHIGKFGILLWVPVYLWLVDLAVKRRSIPLAILAGGAMGAQFLEQADVALFFALALGPYALFACWRQQPRPLPLMLRLIPPLLLTALLLAAHPLLSGYRTAVEDVAAVQAEDPQAQWEFITQWSWPPEESIDFIAPGFFGWRSGEPAGPYVGRMGRSAGWEETGQGFQNFKLENQYLGAVPLLFAMLAVFLAVKMRAQFPTRSREIYFWSAVTVIALLLSFGKYFPLYYLFYQLPVVSSIRNPNKFLQVFQFALAVLSAYGLDTLLRGAAPKTDKKSAALPGLMPIYITGAVVGGMLLLWGIGLMAGRDGAVRAWQEQWGQWASIIVDNRIWALLHGGLMAFLATFAIYLLAAGKRTSAKLYGSVSLLIACMLFDVLFLSRHYVATFDASTLEENEVIQILKSAPEQRVALTSQDNFYNQWLTMLFPYHGISTINVSQMPRMPADYERYLNAVARDPIRHWQLGGVRYVLAPAQVWNQIQQDASLRDQFEIVFAYSVEPANGGVRVVPSTAERPGAHVVLHKLAPHPRYALLAGWRVMDDEQMLTRLASPQFQPFQQALISATSPTDHLPESVGQGFGGSVSRRDFRPGYVRLRVSADQPSVLRLADKYDRYWRAELNGEPVPVMRVDYIAQGVFVPSGLHELILRYHPPRTTWWIQVLGMILVLGALLVTLRARLQARRAIA